MQDKAALWTGQIIRKTRRHKGMTQSDLALAVSDRLGPDHFINQSTVSRWETGASSVSVRARPALADVLGIDQFTLFEMVPDGWTGSKAA